MLLMPLMLRRTLLMLCAATLTPLIRCRHAMRLMLPIPPLMPCRYALLRLFDDADIARHISPDYAMLPIRYFRRRY